MTAGLAFSSHDDPPADARAVVDEGLGAFNDAAAPLHEVRPLAVFVRDAEGRVVGGAVGRRWGAFAELQQLWVHDSQRGRGLGQALLRRFEADCAAHGVHTLSLETFSFQARPFYERLGWRVVQVHAQYPHRIKRYSMRRELALQRELG